MVWFILVFSGVFMFCRFMCESGETASNPPRLRSFFLRFRRVVSGCARKTSSRHAVKRDG
jgi:hypothetical protein